MARRTWHSPEGIVFEGVQTGDGRLFAAGALTWDPQPNGWPYRVSLEDQGGHYGARVVGAITGMTRGEGGGIIADGWVEDSLPDGAWLVQALEAGLPFGTSVDIDDMAVEFVATGEDDGDDVILLAGALPAGAVRYGQPDPANPDRYTVELRAAGLGALVSSATALATDRGLVAAGWRAPAIVAAAGDGEPEGIVLFSDSMDEVVMRITRGRIRGATGVDMPAYHRAAIVLDGASTAPAEGDDPPADADDEDADPGDGDEARVAAAAGCTDCAGKVTRVVERTPDELDAELAALVAAAAAPVRPNRSWFGSADTGPDFGRGDVIEVQDPTSGRTLRGVPMRYEESGQVFGHVALWGQCHTGSASGDCVLTPRSQTGYRNFHHGTTLCADGTLLPTGNLTVGGGHADVRLSYRAALAHYDDVGTLAATVRAGEDEYGVWVCGAGMPDVWGDELAMRKLRAASPSGDWRWIDGALDMVHTHAVNAPGFPVPRAQVASGGQIVALTAAGAADAAALSDALGSGISDGTIDVERIAAAAAAAAVEAFVARQAAESDRVAARAALAGAGDAERRRRALRRLERTGR